jgi:hypothetical protein
MIPQSSFSFFIKNGLEVRSLNRLHGGHALYLIPTYSAEEKLNDLPEHIVDICFVPDQRLSLSWPKGFEGAN